MVLIVLCFGVDFLCCLSLMCVFIFLVLDRVQVYKIMNDIDMVNKEKLFTMSHYTGTRGHSFKIYKKRFRLNISGNTLAIVL